ncbi:hypothetical protein ACFU8I_02825 [Streptomyces sp. NPDC057540]|uniref:hypothetical protein n=1 Tax=Streptomyces sp. NPDC057540 TaxID=3346160 RepID=UPI0036857711
MPTTTPQDRERLAKAVATRRWELGLSITAAAEAAGLSKDTYKRVELARPIRDSGYGKVDKALNWAIGSSAAILNGADGPIETQATPVDGVQIAAMPDSEVKEAVARVAIATTDSLTAREIREFSERVLAELRKYETSSP